MEREQLSWQERGQLWLRLIIRLVLAAAAVVLVAKLGPLSGHSSRHFTHGNQQRQSSLFVCYSFVS